MSFKTESDFAIGTERINLLTDYVCGVYNLSYMELADKLGVYRPHFSRMRNAGIQEWTWTTVCGVCELAAKADASMVCAWLFDEQEDNE